MLGGRAGPAHQLPARPVAAPGMGGRRLRRRRRALSSSRAARYDAGRAQPGLLPAAVADAAAACRRWRSCSPAAGVAAVPRRRRPRVPRRAPADRPRTGPEARRDRLRPRHDHLRRRRPAGAARRRPAHRRGRAVPRRRRAPASGKSTLLGAINGLVPHFTGGTLAGRVTVDGRDTATPPAARARRPGRRRRAGPAGRVRHRHRRGGARLRHGAAGRAAAT